MINKEILEIRKLIKQDDNSTIKICGCYVAGEEKKKTTYINDYLSNLPESDQHKFVEIIKKTLSGTLGKNLHNLEFNKEACNDNGQQSAFLQLLNTELKSNELLERFYDHIIENFSFEGNFLILIAYDVYDVPTKTKDNIKLDDSTEVFKYIICSICPVNLSKAALSYHEETNSIENRIRDWVVETPCAGFMFPSFNDRSSDIYNLLYYVKNVGEMYSEFIVNGLGCEETVPAEHQKQIFQDIIEEVVVNQPDYEVVDIVRDINENLTEIIENNTYDEPVTLDKNDIKNLFKNSGIKEEDLEKIDKKFEEEFEEDMVFDADSIQEKKRFELKTNAVTLNVKPENSHIIKVKMIDGIKCLVIPMDDNVEINGIVSKIKEHLENMNEE